MFGENSGPELEGTIRDNVLQRDPDQRKVGMCVCVTHINSKCMSMCMCEYYSEELKHTYTSTTFTRHSTQRDQATLIDRGLI